MILTPVTYGSKIFMKWLIPIPFVLGGVLLSGCVGPQEMTLIEREQKRLRRDNAIIRRENSALRSGLDGVRSRLADTQATLQEMQRDQSALGEKVSALRYQIDRQMGQSVREGGQRIKDLGVRVARIDDELKAQGTLLKAREKELKVLHEAVLRATQGKSGTKALGGIAFGTQPAEGKPVLSGAREDEQVDYDQAWRLMERNDYRGAIARFKKFLKSHSRSELADNAQYWIGESYYALKQFDQAILEFDTVRRKYPKGDKVPAALLKLGFSFAELGDKVDARLILQELIVRYPESREAVKAKEMVKALES
ncbi:MAG: tol-pal system protein YbgF [Deltaproteobacteria bacterium]|nr:tol-pal system protein YbgF [Deltaproteobacteria bacterium]